MLKLSRWLFLILTLLLLSISPSISSYATEDNAESEDGKEASDQNVAGKDGINEARMGYKNFIL